MEFAALLEGYTLWKTIKYTDTAIQTILQSLCVWCFASYHLSITIYNYPNPAPAYNIYMYKQI